MTSRARGLGTRIPNSVLVLLCFGQGVDISSGHEESSASKRVPNKWARSRVGPFSKEAEHSCIAEVLVVGCWAVNCCDGQSALLPPSLEEFVGELVFSPRVGWSHWVL